MNHLRESFLAFARERGADRLQALRERAFDRFEELGFPTTRQEEWRFTDLAPLAGNRLALGEPTGNGVTPGDLERFGFAGGLVFVDGIYRADLSRAPDGINLAAVRDRLEIGLGDEAPALVALNTAFLEDGACIEIDEALEEPLAILFVGTDGKACHPRNMFHVKPHGRAEIIETYVSLGEGEHWTNAVDIVVLEENAEFHHTRLQIENGAAFHTSNTWVEQLRDSRYTSNVVTLGGRLVRNDHVASLNGEGIVTTLNGLLLARGSQHVDNHTCIEHKKPHCESHELYKAILDDEASGVFTGKIHVFKDAQKTDAKQSSASLLLSDKAVMDAQPQLEIYADDVRCTHGATIGQLDENALFYLRSRGIARKDALSILIRAFAADVTERLHADAARERIDAMLESRLPGGSLAS